MNVLAEALYAASPHSPEDQLGLTRRQFLRVTSVAVGAGFLGLSNAACDQVVEQLIEKIKNRPVRRNISTLALDDPIVQNYRAAVTAMQALPSTDRRNWNRQAQIHRDAPCRHASWLFFPWHRAYLFYFERICQKLSGNPAFGLPYWDWTANPQMPAHFWDGSVLQHSPRVAGPTTPMPADSVGAPVVNAMLDEPNFLLFAGPAVPLNSTARRGPGFGMVEGTPHNQVHNTVGGTMATLLSPLDPVFWMHHNRCEQLWVEWNIGRGHPNTNDPAWANTTFVNEFCDEDGNDVEVAMAVITLLPLLSYRFDTQGA